MVVTTNVFYEFWQHSQFVQFQMVVTTNVFYEFWQHSQFVQFATSSDVIEKCCFYDRIFVSFEQFVVKRKGKKL